MIKFKSSALIGPYRESRPLIGWWAKLLVRPLNPSDPRSSGTIPELKKKKMFDNLTDLPGQLLPGGLRSEGR